MMNKLKISVLLGLVFLIVILAFSILAGFTVFQLNNIAKTVSLMNDETEILHLAETWQANIKQNSARTIAIAYADNGPAMNEMFKEEMTKVTVATTAIQKNYEEYAATHSDTGDKERLALVGVARKEYIEVRDKVRDLKVSGDTVGALALLKERMFPAVDRYIAAAQANIDAQLDATTEANIATKQEIQNLYIYGASLLALAVIIAAGAGWMVSRSIITGIKNTQDVANRIGEGDLSQPIISVGSDEIAALMHSMDIMQQNLVQVVTGVRQSSDSVSTASAEIAQGNNDLSARTEQQASALEETAASMEQLAATVRNNADNAIEADRLAKASTMSAGACSDAVNLVAESMTEINEASKKIGDITTVINGIAFQTNILALNAAIEAARAGEHGRGFAVVATEVRSLAARSAEAAKEIKALIEASEEKVNQGVEHAQQTALQMNGVVVSIQKVAELITDISTATREQAAGIEQVGEAVTQMDTVTQQNAALVEEMAAAAQSLNQQADELVNQVAVFTINT